MKNLTQNAILNTFEEMLREMPFDKITVSALTKRCGINHNTFYYHYQDIYSLLKDWIDRVRLRLLCCDEQMNWDDAIGLLLKKCQENESLVNHLSMSISREYFEKYIFTSADDIFLEYVKTEAKGRPIPEKQIHAIADFCRYAFLGFFLRFLWNGMAEDVDAAVNDLKNLFYGFVEQALAREQE